MALSKEILGFAAEIVDHLRQRGETISTAESLTAGSVSSAIVSIAGASDVFVGEGSCCGFYLLLKTFCVVFLCCFRDDFAELVFFLNL